MIDRAYASTCCSMKHFQGQLWIWAMVDVFWSSCAFDWTKSICSKLQDSIEADLLCLCSKHEFPSDWLPFIHDKELPGGLSFIVKAFFRFSVCTYVSFSNTRFRKWLIVVKLNLLYYYNNFNFLIKKNDTGL